MTGPIVTGRACRSTTTAQRIAAVTVLALAGLGVTACANQPGSAATAATPNAPLLAASLAISSGTWATLPMGHLDDPLNTFWQLLHRPTVSSSWSDQVEATAVATNGGLVLASNGSKLVVGVLPSYHLTFSPLMATADGGHSWSDGLVSGLAADPQALAVGPVGQMLALANVSGGYEVLAARANAYSWQPLVTERSLASSVAGQTCGVLSLGAVGYESRTPTVGANCARPGQVGVFVDDAGRWRLDGPTLPPALSSDTVAVTGMRPIPGGLSLLLSTSGASGPGLEAAWSTNGGVRWVVSPPLRLNPGVELASWGLATGTGMFVLLHGTSARPDLEVLDGPGSTWRTLPSPPAGTATVAFGPATTVQALAASTTVLTVWSLPPETRDWVAGQVLHVTVEFGSSS